MRRAGGEMGLGLGAYVPQLRAQVGVRLHDLVGEGGDLAGRPALGALQHHDRQRPGGARLVGGVARRHADRVLEQPVAPRTLGGDRDRLELLGAGLHPHHGMGQQIVVPGGMPGRTEVRSDDHQQVAVADAPEWNGALFPRLRAGGGQEEKVAALEGAADLSLIGPELLDDLLVEGHGHTVRVSRQGAAEPRCEREYEKTKEEEKARGAALRSGARCGVRTHGTVPC